MKVYTKEELEEMDADVIDSILDEMGADCCRYLSYSEWPHSVGCLVAVGLSDPTIRETVTNLLAASCTYGSLPATNIIIMDAEGAHKVRNLSISVYTLDSYKEKCRQYLENTGTDPLSKFSHLDEEMDIGMNAAIGAFESFAAECEANTDKSTETI